MLMYIYIHDLEGARCNSSVATREKKGLSMAMTNIPNSWLDDGNIGKSLKD